METGSGNRKPEVETGSVEAGKSAWAEHGRSVGGAWVGKVRGRKCGGGNRKWKPEVCGRKPEVTS